jgi:hypothetical protein
MPAILLARNSIRCPDRSVAANAFDDLKQPRTGRHTFDGAEGDIQMTEARRLANGLVSCSRFGIDRLPPFCG